MSALIVVPDEVRRVRRLEDAPEIKRWLPLRPLPGFGGFSHEGVDQFACALREGIRRAKDDCACGQHCKPNTGCRSPGPIQDVPFRGQR